MKARSFALLAMTTALGCATQRASGGAAAADAMLDACAGVPEQEMEASPLDPPNEIERVAPVYRYLWTGRPAHRVPLPHSGKITGVLVTVHTSSRTTLDELARRLKCHVAWMRSGEGGPAAMRACPLGVPGSSAEARMGFGQRFIIAIASEKESVSKEIWRRATALAGRSDDQSEGGDEEE